MKKKRFNIDVLLTVLTDGLAMRKDILSDFQTFLEFMVGDNVYQNQYTQISVAVKASLKRQLSWADSPELDFAIAQLKMMRETVKPADMESLMLGWMVVRIAEYGEWHEIEAFQKGEYEHSDPVFDALDAVDGDLDRIIKI